ncbi:hypothetical protein NFA_15750 [Nocardia farcinica IFM 10152]|uniref:Uncharacterized protein n=1 Tax=Nocardia farcinica (strain IFM 10152) TaxID=247156 RepID=Q5YZH0_NOCFA|nr:hypothetical protein NFA_15750 [Nocardia farcinica IFM 10152]
MSYPCLPAPYGGGGTWAPTDLIIPMTKTATPPPISRIMMMTNRTTASVTRAW